MKIFKYILFFFITINFYSQSKDTIYFLINKKDTLIYRQLATKMNSYEGYKIYYTDKKKVILNNTPVVKGEIWGEKSKYDYKVLKYVSVHFNFNRKEDETITKKYLNTLNLITDREEFLNLEKKGHNFETLGFIYYFIEPNKYNSKYIMRKVYPVTYE